MACLSSENARRRLPRRKPRQMDTTKPIHRNIHSISTRSTLLHTMLHPLVLLKTFSKALIPKATLLNALHLETWARLICSNSKLLQSRRQHSCKHLVHPVLLSLNHTPRRMLRIMRRAGLQMVHCSRQDLASIKHMLLQDILLKGTLPKDNKDLTLRPRLINLVTLLINPMPMAHRRHLMHL